MRNFEGPDFLSRVSRLASIVHRRYAPELADLAVDVAVSARLRTARRIGSAIFSEELSFWTTSWSEWEGEWVRRGVG